MYKCHHGVEEYHALPRSNQSGLSAHLDGLDVRLLLLIQYGIHHLVAGKESVNVLESKTYHKSQCELTSSHADRTMGLTFRFREEYVLSITVSFLDLEKIHSKSGFTHNDRYPNSVEHSEDNVRPPANIPNCRRRDVHNNEVADPVGCSTDR
jgi:hypothetical protein